MTVINWSSNIPPQTGPSTPRFSDQPMTYATLTGDHYQRIRQLVIGRFEQSEAFARSKFEKFYRYEKLVNMISKRKQFDWKANAFLPYAYAVSEQSAAIKSLALLLARPYVSVQGKKAGVEEIAIRRQALLDWHFTGDLDLMELIPMMMRMAERYGKAVAVVTPDWDEKMLKFRAAEELPTAFGPLSRMSWKMRAQRDYRLRADVLDLTDFFPQPGKKKINGPGGMRYCHRRTWLTLDELQHMEIAGLVGPAVGGQSTDDIRDTTPQSTNEYKIRRMFLDRAEDVETAGDLFDRPVELIECPTMVARELIDPAQAQMEEQNGLNPYHRMYLIANRNVVLEDIALPWDHQMKPYVEMDGVPDPYDFYGKGKVEPIEHLCYIGNEITNMRIDNVKMAVNGLIGVDGNRMPAGWKRRLVSQPWGAVETKGPPDQIIQRLPLGDVTSSSYTEQQQVWTLIQESSAVNETMLGAPGPQRTLGEHQLKAESSTQRLKMELVVQAKQLLGFPYGLSGFVIGLDRQYLPLPTYFNVIGPDSPDDFMEVGVGAEDFAIEDQLFSYLPTGATEGINIASKRADLAQMLQAIQPFLPLMLQQGFNLVEMVKTVLKTFGHDPSRYFLKLAGPAGAGEGGMMPPGGVPGMAGAGPPGIPGAPPGLNPIMAALGSYGRQ